MAIKRGKGGHPIHLPISEMFSKEDIRRIEEREDAAKRLRDAAEKIEDRGKERRKD
tara:strand:- start:87 stop:254 length:168 start_codon:yes stop_codon:yes gene_type:complete